MVKRLSSTDQNDSPLVNVPTPVSSGDAVNKSYADTKAAASSVSNVDNTSNATERAATATLTNKDLSSSTNTFPDRFTPSNESASVFMGADTSTGSGSYVVVKFDTVSSDIGSNYDTSTGEYTCPADGFYLVTVGVLFTTTTRAVVAIESDAKQIARASGRGNENTNINLSGGAYLSSGDTIFIKSYRYSTSAFFGNATQPYTNMSIIKLA